MNTVRKVEPPRAAGRVPPHNLDAEAAVLSAMLLEPAALDVVAALLTPADFYSGDNGRIFEAVLAVRDAQKAVDVLTVNAWIRDRDGSPQGLGSYLAQLCDATPAPAHVEAHAAIVRDKARLRRMIVTCQRVAAEGYGDVGEVAEWLGASEQAVFECASTTNAAGLEPVAAIVRDTFKALETACESGQGMLGTPTGYVGLDALLGGLRPATLTILAARPGMGKSALASCLALNVVEKLTDEAGRATKLPKTVAYFTLEMGREECCQRMICSVAGVTTTRLRLPAKLEPDEWTRLTEASRWLSTSPLLIDASPVLTSTELRARVRRAKADAARAGVELGLVVVDHLLLMKPTTTARETSRDQEVGSITRALKVLCTEANVPVLALCQLNRQSEGRRSHRPVLADLRDSGNIEQDADNVIFLYRDDYYTGAESAHRGVAEAIVAKQRNGPTGSAWLRFVANTTKYEDMPMNEWPEDWS